VKVITSLNRTAACREQAAPLETFSITCA